MTAYCDYTGIIHVHSNYSDGQGTIEKIVSCAQEAKCDFIILSDHNTLKALPDEGLYNTTLLLVGEEVTVGARQGHYLALSLTSEVSPYQNAQETINSVANQGGLGFIAHPCAKTTRRLLSFSPSIWKNWHVKGFTGLEIWNYSQDWKDQFHGLLTLPSSKICTRSYSNGPFMPSLQKWDELLRTQKVVGIGGVDAHGYVYSYKDMFKTLRTHILLRKALSFCKSSFKENKKQIYHALKKGNCYFSNDLDNGSAGFLFTGDNGKNQAIMGDELPLNKDVNLTVSSPEPAVIRIIKNGREIAQVANSRKLNQKVYEPGAYRAELFCPACFGPRKSYRPWIFSNPIYVIN